MRPTASEASAIQTTADTSAIPEAQCAGGEETSRIARVLQLVLRKCGIDRAIAYTLMGRGWGVIATPLTWFFISRWLRPAEQGFYYTFGSVIALNLFLELGLAFVLVQFASHEKAHLEWTEDNTLSGSEVAKDRLAAVLKIATKWYCIAAVLVVLVVMPTGLVFFSRNGAASPVVAWRGPWMLLSIASAVELVTLPLLAILEGCGKIWHIASLRLGQSVFANAALWLTLALHGALYGSAVFQAVDVGCAVIWIVLRYRGFFRTLFERNLLGTSFRWSTEVWPFQWRIALSWLGGYFVSQIMNPVLFATQGPIVAGQMGMSLSVCNALVGVSFSWMSTKASPFGVLVARRSWEELDKMFFATVRQSLSVLIVTAVLVFLSLLGLRTASPALAQRLLTPIPFGLLLLSAVTSHIVYCEALYLRTHKAEPFLMLSLVTGGLSALTTIAVAKPFGAEGVAAANLACGIVGLALGTHIFFRKRKHWHA